MYHTSLTPLLIAFLFQIITLESGWNSPMDDKQLKKKTREKVNSKLFHSMMQNINLGFS